MYKLASMYKCASIAIDKDGGIVEVAMTLGVYVCFVREDETWREKHTRTRGRLPHHESVAAGSRSKLILHPDSPLL